MVEGFGGEGGADDHDQGGDGFAGLGDGEDVGVADGGTGGDVVEGVGVGAEFGVLPFFGGVEGGGGGGEEGNGRVQGVFVYGGPEMGFPGVFVGQPALPGGG